MIFWVMIQLICMNCCWFTPVWARTYLRLHKAFYSKDCKKNPILLSCTYSFTVSVLFSQSGKWLLPTIPLVLPNSFPVFWCDRVWFACLKLTYWWCRFECTHLWHFASWEKPLSVEMTPGKSLSHTDGLVTPVSPRLCYQTPSGSSNFPKPKPLSYPELSVGWEVPQMEISPRWRILPNASLCPLLSIWSWLSSALFVSLALSLAPWNFSKSFP